MNENTINNAVTIVDMGLTLLVDYDRCLVAWNEVAKKVVDK